MSGHNYKQGYVCKECLTEGILIDKVRIPLYRRVNQRYEFSGYVECPSHGIQKGIRVRDVER